MTTPAQALAVGKLVHPEQEWEIREGVAVHVTEFQTLSGPWKSAVPYHHQAPSECWAMARYVLNKCVEAGGEHVYPGGWR